LISSDICHFLYFGLHEKWTSDGYEILEEITRVPANEDAPIHLKV